IKGEGVMETFKLVSKITAKHLYNRLKGKSEPIDRKKPEKPAKHARPKTVAGHKKVPIPVSEPEPLPDANPFGDSIPFPEASNPLNAGYEKMEEVSLEQLLEGRERPATLSGAIPVPIPDDIEELGAEELVPAADENPLDVAVADEPLPPLEPFPSPAAVAPANGQIEALEARVRLLEGSLNDVLRTLNDLTSRLKNQIGR
ncbi:MAG TPA: hypothetical protein VKU62_09960, partial [Thermoanaerobaculia bacterium]|nr:hypothetical protein [Thermoanaerobaculia bacterium]